MNAIQAASATSVFGWSGGRAPSGVRSAIRHEIRRRGLRMVDVADEVGVSRPQLSNILQGRFGASSCVADRLRNFILDGAKTVGADMRGGVSCMAS